MDALERYFVKTLARRMFAEVKARHGREGAVPMSLRKGERIKMVKAGKFRDKRGAKREAISYSVGECGTAIWVGAWGKAFVPGGPRPYSPRVIKVGIALDARSGKVDATGETADAGPVIFVGLADVAREAPAKSLRTLARACIEAARNGIVERASAQIIEVA